MLSIEAQDQGILSEFFDFVYGEATGFAYVAVKAPDSTDFLQHFFAWPSERDLMAAVILAERSKSEVYYAPSLFSERSAKKSALLGAGVVWAEFDGNAPTDYKDLPEPSLRIQSSNPGHQHVYWRLDQFEPPGDVERINRSIAYLLGADASGWDATQILRPPTTFNHKRKKFVQILSAREERISLGSFVGLPDPPPPAPIPLPTSLPDVTETVLKHALPMDVVKLFREGSPTGDRSAGLMQLGYLLAELQLEDLEIFSLLVNADGRWGKFKGRQDQHQRLMEIVVRARSKYPLISSPEKNLRPLGFLSILTTEVKLEWVWDGYLQTKGYFLLSGPSGVGKTQVALQQAIALALGRESFLGRSIPQSRKVGFFSLEMGLEDIKYFIDIMARDLSQKDKERLETDLQIFPVGEPLYLDHDAVRKEVEDLTKEFQFDGVVFDSMGSTTGKSISDEENAKALMDWNDRFRKQQEVFTCFIHHHRKAGGTNKKPNKLEDVYGNQYITARATTVMCLWPTLDKSVLEAIPLKTRLSNDRESFKIRRSKNLNFDVISSSYSVPDEPLDAVEEGPVLGQGPGFGQEF